MVTVSLVGCAHIHTPGFVNKLKARPEVQVKWVWDPEPARAQRWANELGAKVTRSLAKATGDDELSAAVICSQTNLHKKLIAAATKAGKHVFAEKPLGLGAKDSLAMAEMIEQAGVRFQTGYFNRGLPAHQFIRSQIAAGSLGTITRVRGSLCHSGALGDWFMSKPDNVAEDWRWMADPRVAGCGAFGDLGTHLLDILMWLMGDVEAVTAQIRPVIGRYADCDETGEAMLRFKNGVIGTLAAGWVDVDNPVTLLVSGTEGHAAVIRGELFFKSSKVEGADGKQPWTQLPPAWPHAFDLFLDALLGQPNVPLVSVREAAARVAVMEAMYKAARQGKWVKVD